MPSTIRIPCRPIVVFTAIGLLVLSSCGRPSDVSRSDALDSAVEMFLAGHHRQAIESLNALLERPVSDGERREIYYYLGRAYLEQDDVSRAVDSFAAGVQLGDSGPCLEYLERLRSRMASDAATVARAPVVTRRQLSALVEGWLARGEGRDPHPDPIVAMTERGWLERMPDGRDHADSPVTRAALFVFVSRMCASIECVGSQVQSYPLSDRTVSGRDLVAQLGRVMPWPPPDGR